jgi:phosphoribosylamine--glycine ligase
MGAYSPAPIITPEMHARVMKEVIEPTIKGLADDGIPYLGFLYAGLMIAPDGTPNVLEFNCRFGDPETQPIMMRLKSDLVTLCEAAVKGRLSEHSIAFDARPALGVVMAAGGYPGSYRKGDVISGLPAADAANVKVFHAGTALSDGALRTSGGRVLCVTALGNTVADAQTKAYQCLKRITWDGVQYRNDIGYRAVARERNG